MATPEPIESSPRLRRAADAERRRLVKALDRAARRAEALRSQLAGAEDEIRGVKQRLVLLTELAGESIDAAALPAGDALAATPNQPEPPYGYLRGSMIRIVAVRLLVASSHADRPIHYQKWLELIRSVGYDIAGQDPAATFLTQVSRSPVVVRTGEPGMYTISLDAPAQLRERWEALNSELLALHHGQQTIDAIASARERRTELIAEIARVERALEEAIQSVPAADN